MSSTSSASSSSASTTSSKCGGMSTTTKSNIVRSIRTMPIISSARDALAGGRLDRRAQHAQRRRLVRREEAVHQLRVDGVDHGGRVGRGVLRRDAEQHRVVAELEVGVDERDPARDCASRAAPRGSSRRRSCRRHPWSRRRRRPCRAAPARPRPRRGSRRRTSSRRRARPPGGSGARRRRSSSASRTPARSAPGAAAASAPRRAARRRPRGTCARCAAPRSSPSAFGRGSAPNTTTVGSPGTSSRSDLVDRSTAAPATMPASSSVMRVRIRSSGSTASTR